MKIPQFFLFSMFTPAKKLSFQASHVKFSIVFCSLLYSICNALNIDKLAKWFYRQGQLEYFALSAYLIAGLCLFISFFVIFAHRRTIKPLAIFIVISSTAATYFISKYNVAVDNSMILNTLHTDPTEVRQLLSVQMLPYALFLIVLPVLFILTGEITFKPRAKYLLSSLLVVASTLGIALVSLYTEYTAIHRAGNVSNKYIVHSLVPVNVLRSVIGVTTDVVSPYFATTKKEIPITGHVAAPGNLLVVLAIGETSRQKNFSLYGYDRQKTNPVLSGISGLHLLNGIARRGTTLYALPEILEKNGIKLPAIVSKLGISTSCYVNYTLYDNCTAVGETEATHCGHNGKCYDEDVIPMLENDLKSYQSGYRFEVLHLGGGSHGPIYNDRYPPEFQQFKPMCNDADIANQCTLEQIYNSYDNTILYVDHVVGQLINQLDHSGAPYVFMYLSDHGESLMEDGRMFHGMPPGIALPPEQAHIPLIVKSSVPISIVKRDEYLQQDVFDTVLDLFSIDTPLFDKKGSFIKKSTPAQ